MRHPQHRIPDYTERTKSAADTAAAHYDDVVNLAGMGAAVGIRTGDWTGYTAAFELLQVASFEAINRRRNARMADHVFGVHR